MHHIISPSLGTFHREWHVTAWHRTQGAVEREENNQSGRVRGDVMLCRAMRSGAQVQDDGSSGLCRLSGCGNTP